MPPLEAFAIPLNAAFRFVHEPLDCGVDAHLQRFVGRENELDELVARIILSDGGAFLLTGYRGVGKSTFVNRVIRDVRQQLPQLASIVGTMELVDVHLNIPRAMDAVELMYHVLRGLFLRLSSLNLLNELEPALRRDLELAFYRTSRSIATKTSQGIEGTAGVTLGAPLPQIAGSSSSIALGTKRTRSETHEIAYLAYDDKAAEYDVIHIARRLSRGFTRHRSWRRRAIDWMGNVEPRTTRLKVLLVFDELDKIDERRIEGSSSIDAILANLKTLFTTSGISFLFVAGKDVHDRWLEDVGRGDSIYESVFSYAQYLPPLWAHADPMCDPFLDHAAFEAVDAGEAASAYAAFKKFLAFSGRGIPRRILRKFNERVRWASQQPRLTLSRDDVRQFKFFADLHDVLVTGQAALLGELRDEMGDGRNDRKRLGLYYLVDWILLRGVDEFTLQDAVAASGKLSRLIAFGDETAPAIVGRLLTLLVDQEYLDAVPVPGSGTKAANLLRYRLTRKRLVEMGSLAGVVEQEAQAVIDESKSERFRGRYEIASIIGRGGMSTVYLAHDRTLRRKVAVKEQLAELVEDPDARARFRREVDVLSRLQHENIVRIYDVDSEAKQPYIVLEYIEGVRLTDLIDNGSLTTEEDVLRIARDIVNTVQYIHEQGVLWRDPKPNNVMITSEGRVVLLDFGISLIMAVDQPESGTLVGTPAYSSPEQLRGEPLDVRSDVYCLGIVLYQMVAERLPFGNDTSSASAYRRMLERPEPPRGRVTVSQAFEAAIMKCLEPGRDDRYPTAAALLDALPVTATRQGLVATAQELLRVGARAERREREDTDRFQALLDVPPRPASAPRPEVRTPSLVSNEGQIHELTPPRVRIGRSLDNEIVLADVMVSRFHAEVRLQPDGWTLEDQNSRNSTLLNGNRMTAPVVLREGDTISIGPTTLTFRAGDGDLEQRVRRGDLFDFVSELRDLAGMSPLEIVLERGLDRAIELARAERGFVMLADATKELRFVCARARGGIALPGTSFSTSRKIPEETFERGELLAVADLMDVAEKHHGTIAIGIRHVLCAPLIPRGGQPVGVVYLDSRERGPLQMKSVHEAVSLLSAELGGLIQQSRELESRTFTQQRDLSEAAGVLRALQQEPDREASFYEIALRVKPHTAVGGDFCKYFEWHDSVAFAVGDVAGKGVAAGLVASFLIGLFEQNARGGLAPSRVVDTINKAAVSHTADSRYATVFYGVLSADGAFSYCNAGHIPPVLVSGTTTERLETGGPIIGLFDSVPYEDGTIRLKAGDTIVVFSDGLSEALNSLSEEFGEARIQTLVSEHKHRPSHEIADLILSEAVTFSGDVVFSDDVSVAVLKYRTTP